jgi:hypothetical protein
MVGGGIGGSGLAALLAAPGVVADLAQCASPDVAGLAAGRGARR